MSSLFQSIEGLIMLANLASFFIMAALWISFSRFTMARIERRYATRRDRLHARLFMVSNTAFLLTLLMGFWFNYLYA